MRGARVVIYADQKSDTPVMVALAEPGEDIELKALAFISSILDALDEDQRKRVLAFLTQKFT